MRREGDPISTLPISLETHGPAIAIPLSPRTSCGRLTEHLLHRKTRIDIYCMKCFQARKFEGALSRFNWSGTDTYTYYYV